MTSTRSDPIQAYYRAAVLGLRALDQREGRARRFGGDAKAQWERFRGKLDDGDRLQLLLRDASAPWGVAFAGAQIFRLPGVATDEPFGAAWTIPNAKEAEGYLDSTELPSLATCAALLGIEALPVTLPELKPGTQIVAGGGAAILALAAAFAGRDDLDWARQVTIVADAPQTRQIAGLASIFVGAVRPCGIIASDRLSPAVEGERVLSTDAEPAVRDSLC